MIAKMAKLLPNAENLFTIKCYILYLLKCSWEFYVTNTMRLRRKCRTTERLDGKIVVITGANSGIGKETALQLSLRGAQIIIGCRDLTKAENAVKEIKDKNPNAIIKYSKLDLSSIESVRQFAKTISEEENRIDVLINNAGVMMCPEWQTEDGFEMQFGTNYLGHFQLTHSLMPLLKNSPKARVINVSSICHILGKIHLENINLKNGTYAPLKAYSQSKLAEVLLTREMARRLGPESNVNIYCLHPGVVFTEIARHFPLWLYYIVRLFGTTIQLGSQTTLYCALEPSLDSESGFYYDDCHRIDSMVSQARDDTCAQRLYELSCDLVKLENHLKIESSPTSAQQFIKIS